MKTINSPSLLLDFRRSGGDYSAVLGKFGADLGSLELFWFQGSFFGRFSALLRQVGAKMATKSGRVGGLGRNMVSRSTQEGPGSMQEGPGRRGPELLGPL